MIIVPVRASVRATFLTATLRSLLDGIYVNFQKLLIPMPCCAERIKEFAPPVWELWPFVTFFLYVSMY